MVFSKQLLFENNQQNVTKNIQATDFINISYFKS